MADKLVGKESKEIMDKLFKVTRVNLTTFNNMKWKPGIAKRKKSSFYTTCSSRCLHAFRTLEQAKYYRAFFRGNYLKFQPGDLLVWNAEGNVKAIDWNKVGCSSLKITTLHGIMDGNSGKIRKPTRLERLMLENSK